MRESEIESYLVKRVESLGGEVRKVEWVGRRGAPDRVVMLPYERMDTVHNGKLVPARPCTIWVELKNPETVLTFPRGEREEAQAREHARMRRAGQHVEVIGTIEGVDKLLEGL